MSQKPVQIEVFKDKDSALTEIEVMPQYGNSKYENNSSVIFASSNQKLDELIFYEISITSKSSSFK